MKLFAGPFLELVEDLEWAGSNGMTVMGQIGELSLVLSYLDFPCFRLTNSSHFWVLYFRDTNLSTNHCLNFSSVSFRLSGFVPSNTSTARRTVLTSRPLFNREVYLHMHVVECLLNMSKPSFRCFRSPHVVKVLHLKIGGNLSRRVKNRLDNVSVSRFELPKISKSWCGTCSTRWYNSDIKDRESKLLTSHV